MDIGTAAALFGVAVTSAGGIVWSIRQEGRLNAHDQRFELKEAQDDERHKDTKERLQRIENKLDAMNGKH